MDKLVEIQQMLNTIVDEVEQRKKEEERLKGLNIKNLEKKINKILSFNTYELSTGYGVGTLKDALKSLLEIVIDQNSRLKYLEKNSNLYINV